MSGDGDLVEEQEPTWLQEAARAVLGRSDVVADAGAVDAVVVGVPINTVYSVSVRQVEEPAALVAAPAASAALAPPEAVLDSSRWWDEVNRRCNLNSSVRGDGEASTVITTVAMSSVASRIESLGMSNCDLTELPISLCSLPALTSLGLNVNMITELPVALTNIATLRLLSLHENKLTRIAPEVLTSLPRLETLSMSDNALVSLPPSVLRLTALRSLDIGFNQLIRLPEALATLPHLANLDLRSNVLTHLPAPIALELPSLRVMRLDNNPMQLPPSSIMRHSSPIDKCDTESARAYAYASGCPASAQRLTPVESFTHTC